MTRFARWPASRPPASRRMQASYLPGQVGFRFSPNGLHALLGILGGPWTASAIWLLRADAAAFLSQTLLSWKGAPPIGATTSAPVSLLMPRPPIWDLLGWIDSAISTPRRRPSNSLAVSVVSPRMLPSVTASPSAIESAAASSGWIITVGPPSRACEPGVSLKLVLR